MNDFSESPSAWKGPFSRATARLATSTRQTDFALPGTPAPVENEVPISELPLAGALFGDEQIPIVQNGISCRSTVGYVSKSGQAPVYINKTIQLVYPATIGQTFFSLNIPDHYGNQWLLTDANALQVTVGGIRLIQDDGTGIGQYTVNLPSNSITLLTPFGTDPVVIVGDGDVVVFDIYSLTKQTVTVNVNQSQIVSQSLIIATANVVPPLALAPNGSMTILYVNGRAFSDASTPPSFTVSGKTITWVDPVYSVVPGDMVTATYAYGPPAGGVPSASAFTTEAVAVTAPNTLAPLAHLADGAAFILVVDGTSFVAVGAGAAFHVSGRIVTWLSTIFNIGTSSNVSATYSYVAGS